MQARTFSSPRTRRGRRTLESLRALVAAPVFDGDPVRTRAAFLINAVTLTVLASSVFALVGSVLGGRMPLGVRAVHVLGVVLCLRSLAWIRAGKILKAARLTVVFEWAAVTAILAFLGTIRTPALGFYLLLIVLAGVLFGLRAMLGSILLSSLTVAALIAAGNAGWLPQPDFVVNVTQWVSATALFACVGGLTYAVIHFVQDALHEAEKELAERRVAEAALQAKNAELATALEQVKTLTGLLPVCGWCRKVRSDDGYWDQLESYVSARTDAQFTHGICPDCRHEYFPEHRVRKD